MKILIADDNADSRMALRKTLESAGHEIMDVSNGNEALNAIKETPAGIRDGNTDGRGRSTDKNV